MPRLRLPRHVSQIYRPRQIGKGETEQQCIYSSASTPVN